MNIATIPDDWRALLAGEFASPYFVALSQFVDAQRAAHPDAILPAEDEVFNALRLTPLAQVRVVILGQDPYPTPGHAHGLAFSVQPDVKPIPGSLRNMFRELATDIPVDPPRPPRNGNLVRWARQGVLLLNTVLTVHAKRTNSHQKQGWEKFTDAVIKAVSANADPSAFILWGLPAQKKASLIDTGRHTIIQSIHPSPLSANRGFYGTRPFSKANAALLAAGRQPIDWHLDA